MIFINAFLKIREGHGQARLEGGVYTRATLSHTIRIQ